jgi:hypothetical protein
LSPYFEGDEASRDDVLSKSNGVNGLYPSQEEFECNFLEMGAPIQERDIES